MKNIVFGFVLLGVSAAYAQGYVGADITVGKIGISCASNNVCEQKHGGYNIRIGSKLPEAYSFKLDDFSLDTVEIGHFKVGRVNADGQIRQFVNSPGTVAPNIVVTQITVPSHSSLSGNGLYSALVARYVLAPDLDFFAKAGLAYVASTVTSTVNNVSLGGLTENHWSPLLGFGVDYEVISSFKLNAGLQMVRIKAGSASGTVRQFAAGGQYSF